MEAPSGQLYYVSLLDDLHRYFPDVLYNSDRFTTVQDLLQYIQEQSRTHFNLYNRGHRQYLQSQAQNQAQTQTPVTSATPAPTLFPSSSDQSTQHTPVSNSSAEHPVTPPRPAVSMLPTPLLPQPPSFVPFHSTATEAATHSVADAVAGAGVPPSTPLFMTSYNNLVDGPPRLLRTNNPFRAPRNAHTPFQIHVENRDMDNVASSSQFLSSLLGIAFGEGAADITGVNGFGGFGGLPAGFLEPVVVRPSIQQIDAASDISTLTESLEGNCAVCQDTLTAGDTVRQLTACNHSFHRECIDTWFERSVNCPVCRHDVREPAANE